MLYSDTYWLISDDKANNFNELHTFAKECGFTKGDMYLSNGIPYYAIWSKQSRFKALAEGVIIVDRAKMKRQLQKGKMGLPKVVQDFYPYKKYMAKWLKELVIHHGLKKVLKFIPSSIGVVATDKRAEALFVSPLDSSILLEINAGSPNGRLSLVDEEGKIELDITPDIQKLIVEKRRFVAK